MKFDPASKTLMTDAGQLIKQLSCHRKMQLEQLQAEPGTGHWHCAACVHRVLDTALLTQAQVQAAVAADPGTCLLIRAGQHNVQLVDR